MKLNPWKYYDSLMSLSRRDYKDGWQLPDFYYGINKISNNVGTLNCDLYRKQGEDREKVKTGISNKLLNRRPSPMYGAMTFKQTLIADAIWYGAGRAYIHRDAVNPELILLNPAQTVTGVVDGEVWNATYVEIDTIRPDSRLTLFEKMDADPNNVVMIPDRDCFRVVGFGNGLNGVPLYDAARLTIESAQGAESRVKDQIKKGFVGKLMLSAPQESPAFRTAEQAQEFLNDFTERHGADGAAEQVGLLRGGITASTLNVMDNNAAEFAETRKMLGESAAKYLQLEYIPGMEKSNSYNSLEQKQLAYLNNALEPWLVRVEQEADYKLLSARQFNSGEFYHKFNVESMLRTDIATTAATFSSLISSKIMNPNEARAKLDMNPYPGGELFENPNTTSGAVQLEGQEQGQDPDEPQDDREASAVENRIQLLLNAEEKQVTKRLKRGDTLESIEEWYNKFEANLGDVVESLGGERIIAQTHCVESLRCIARKPKHFCLDGEAKLITQEILNV
ncbi:phage portal protein [bacterium]|nr:phage portal protein [bacterium]